MTTTNNRAGELYRPGNGTEALAFMAVYCDQCRNESEEHPCLILANTILHDIGDPKYPKQWVYDKAGCPACTAFKGHYNGPEALRHDGACDDPNQMRLFQ